MKTLILVVLSVVVVGCGAPQVVPPEPDCRPATLKVTRCNPDDKSTIFLCQEDTRTDAGTARAEYVCPIGKEACSLNGSVGCGESCLSAAAVHCQ